MNDRLRGLWDWWFWHRQHTGDLLDVLRNPHLSFSPGGGLPIMARLCADMTDIQAAYIDSLRSRSLDLVAMPASTPVSSVSDLRSRFADLDRQLSQALEAIKDEEVDAIRIQRGDGQIPIFILMSSLVESLLIFHGKVSVYARLAGVDLPASWNRYV